MAIIKLAQNRIDEALAFLEPLQDESFPVTYMHIILGQAYLRRRLFKNAEAAFRRAIERDDDNSEAHDGLGIALRRQGFYEDAIYEHTTPRRCTMIARRRTYILESPWP